MEELYRYDARNRLTELVKQGSVTRFAYDAAGNLLQDDRAAYTYDNLNRAVKAETFDGNIQINHYDAEGLRHEMEENGRLVQFIFNTEKEVVTETEGNVTNRLIRGSGLIARTTDAESARTYYHYAADEMGSITHLTDADGKVLNRYGYDAWGNLTACEEQVENRFRYTGEQFDAITQQYYLRARFYNPVVARFTQEDTYRGDGLNLYAYCANNPVGYVDPSGHQPKCVKDAAQKYMVDGLGKEEAYRKAYQDHVKQKLANAASLPVQELIKLEERVRRLGLKVDSSVNRKKNPETETPDAEPESVENSNKTTQLSDKELSRLRRKAVREAWKQEKELVEKTGYGSRNWTTDEIEELLTTGRVKGYEGQHMKSVKQYPEYAGNPNNIQFLKGRNMDVNEHLDAHMGNYQNPTNWYHDSNTGVYIGFGDYVPW